MTRINWLLKRAKTILQTEGVIALVRWGFAFLGRRLLQYGTYYLYEYATETVQKLNEADYMPGIDNFTLEIVSTNQEADELEAGGLEFRSHVINGRERLDKGAIAFCVFVDKELASIGWAATTEEARLANGELPIKANFANNESVDTGWWTNPKFRRNGLGLYVGYKRSQFLSKIGTVVQRSAIRKGNIVSQRAFAKRAPTMYGEGRYLRILWWKWWKEKPLTIPAGK
jgi:hypothetical protein